MRDFMARPDLCGTFLELFSSTKQVTDILKSDIVLTPDSSRFWPAERYEVGRGQESLDKQPLRGQLVPYLIDLIAYEIARLACFYLPERENWCGHAGRRRLQYFESVQTSI